MWIFKNMKVNVSIHRIIYVGSGSIWGHGYAENFWEVRRAYRIH